MILNLSVFFPTRANKERRTGKIPAAFFRDAQGFGRLDVGSRAGLTSSRSLHHHGFPRMTCDIF